MMGGLRSRIVARSPRCAACHSLLGHAWRLWEGHPLCHTCYSLLAECFEGTNAGAASLANSTVLTDA